MFLYFVQRKGWLADDSEFLETFWNTYNKSGESEDKFFEKWLKVLFFEAFNNQKNLLNTNQRAYLPEDIRKALWEAPYLNGGLFKKNKLDEPVFEFQISDSRFGQIFNLFQKYNFTITEDSPLDQEVAVDPEVIGKVHEGLVNVSENVDERGEAGIFYTPRTEIDLMCRLSLVDNLANHLGKEHKNLFYEVIFSLDQEDKEQADKALAKAKLWLDVEKRLNEITVLDPACGSGSFLVGMLYVLGDLLERAEKQRGQLSDNYKRKKRIIGQSLYGVDVMDWACHVAELRLWLSLIVDAEFTKEELTIREEPLLPHFSFKVRCGDSLVQEVGGVDMAHRRGVLELSQNMKRRLRELQIEKAKFYSSDKTGKFKSPEALESQEVLIFRELLQDRSKTLDNQAKDLMRIQAEKRAHRQYSLTGQLEGPAEQFTLEREKREQQITALKAEQKSLESLHDNLRDKTTVPFVWDISFAEIFSGDNHGFDIVIGNPPYVRQENIAAPTLPDGTVVTENKKEYKAKLARSVYKEYQRFFGYKPSTDRPSHKLDAKSDLYIYFYFHGLSLLNDKGSFCFITSNSWLDVGYGRDLQEFLLKRCQVKLVLDNKAKRSFKSTDVNTVIVLFGAPADAKATDEISLDKAAKFVMFYVPFEEALHPVVFEEIEEFSEKTTRPEYRVFPIKQDELLADGCEIPEEAEGKQSRGPLIKTAKYIGNKWGGKYLRAPDIYWTILEKGKGKLVRLGDIAAIRRGFTTGANEFFYLDDEKIREWGIEKDYLKPVIKGPRECKRICLDTLNLKNKVFICAKSKRELKNTAALEYIKWGESQDYHKRPTCATRGKWYELKPSAWPTLVWTKSVNDRHLQCRIPFRALVDQRLYEMSYKNSICLNIVLNSAITVIFKELFGRVNLGEGALDTAVYEANSICIVDPELVPLRSAKEIEAELSKRDVLPVSEELTMQDRQQLDTLIFDELGLTKGERDAVYEALIDLVESRLKKAESLQK